MNKRWEPSRVTKLYNYLVKTTSISHSPIVQHIVQRLEHVLKSCNESPSFRHRLCTHRYPCVLYSIQVSSLVKKTILPFVFNNCKHLKGFVQRFLVGFLLQLGVRVLGSLGKIAKNPTIILRFIKAPENTQLGLFLGSYVAIFRVGGIIFWHLYLYKQFLHKQNIHQLNRL